MYSDNSWVYWVVDEMLFKMYVYSQFTVSNLSKCYLKNMNAYMYVTFIVL